jgi:hypothetical protein
MSRRKKALLRGIAGQEVSIAELARLVAEVTGFGGRITFDARKPDRAPRKLLDVSRLAQLGWRARIQLREGLAATYAGVGGNLGELLNCAGVHGWTKATASGLTRFDWSASGRRWLSVAHQSVDVGCVLLDPPLGMMRGM